MITRSIWPAFAACTPLAAAVDRDRLELLVQRQLLGQRIAQLGIVVDNQDLARVRH